MGYPAMAMGSKLPCMMLITKAITANTHNKVNKRMSTNSKFLNILVCF